MTRLEAYEDLGGQWRWRLWAANGRIIASSGESFDSHANALRAATALKRGAAQAVVSSTPGIGTEALLRFRALIDDATTPTLVGRPKRKVVRRTTPRRTRVRRLTPQRLDSSRRLG